MRELTPSLLRELLHYDAETGVFTWRNKPSIGISAGSAAGTIDRRGYIRIGIDGHVYRAHRLVWLYVHGEWPAGEVDHIDGDKKNNSLRNLRVVGRQENQQNQRVARKGNGSGLLGVSFHAATRKWRARIWRGSGNISLGLYSTPEQAHAAYVAAKREIHEGCTL